MDNFKKKVAIIIDKIGWAYYNSALEIQKNLKNDFDIDIIDMEMFGNNVVKVFLLSEKYDLMFFMWRGLISWLYSDYSKDYIKQLGFSFDEFMERFFKSKNIVTGVYDHLFLQQEQERTEFILNNVKDYLVSSKKLQNIYSNFEKKPSREISDGVDLELFKMYNTSKYKNIGKRNIKIGWCGNSKFTDENDDDLKGLNKIIKPAIEELIEEGYNIELDIADKNIKEIPHIEMPQYYNDIDIYVCASRTEGTPNPILEAMACGVPIISTDVGIVSEVFGVQQKNFIIERYCSDLKEKISEMLVQRNKMEKLSKENLKQIQEWSWNKKSNEYKEFFVENIRKGIKL